MSDGRSHGYRHPDGRKDGESRQVAAKSESWNLTWWRDGRDDGADAVTIEVERDGHNFTPALTAKEAGALIDALLDLLPEARQHAQSIARGAP